jgi:hypothetical protein
MATLPYAPPEDASDKPLKRISIRLEEDETEELERIAETWDALDAALEAKRRHRWSSASVMERMIRVGMNDFWTQIGGPKREGESDAEVVARAVDAVKKHRQSKPAK